MSRTSDRDDVELARCIEVAVRLALRQPWIPGPQDREERRAIAMTSAWEALTRSDPARPQHEVDAYVRRTVRSRLIDAERSSRGLVRRNGLKTLRPRAVALVDDLDLTAPDVDEVVVVDMIRWLARGDRRTETILTGLAAGERRQDIAAAVGVTPGRVTQIVAAVRDGDRMTEMLSARPNAECAQGAAPHSRSRGQ